MVKPCMSLWEKDLNQNFLPKLEEDREVDTLIIGGGIAGLTTLYFLRNQKKTILVDASLCGNGVTKNTTGKLTYLQNTIYTDLKNNIDEETAIEYLKSQKYAIHLAKKILEKEHISCNLEQVDSYVFTNQEKHQKKLEQEKAFLESQQIDVQVDNLPLPISYKSAICVHDTYVFHPIKYINALKEMLKNSIYEQTKIIKIKRNKKQYICYGENFKIRATNVIVTCHYPFFFLPFCLPLKSHIEKSYILAREVPKNLHYSCITVGNPTLSVRFYEEKKKVYQICLASSTKTSKNQEDVKNFFNVQKQFGIKEEEIVARWSNVDIITDDHLPYIGEVKKNFYVATGFNTWGMTNGILAGEMLSKAVKKEDIPFKDLFTLKRSNFYQIKSFFSNTLNSAVAFIGSKKKEKEWYQKNPCITKINEKSVGIYVDKESKKHTVFTTCPHMGCSLIFNEQEKTWDCPCHSSRFSLDGECLKGPSTKDIRYKE